MHRQTVRTNNSVESFHKLLFETIGRAHPNVWVFLAKIQKIEHVKAVQLTRVVNGIEIVEVRRRQYRLAENRIRAAEIILDENHDVERFLRTVSHQSSRLMDMFAPIPGFYFFLF